MSPRPFLPQHPDLCLSSLCTLSFPLLPRGHISNLATLTDVLIYAPPPDRPKRILCSLIELNWTPMARHLPDIAKKSSHDKKTTQRYTTSLSAFESSVVVRRLNGRTKFALTWSISLTTLEKIVITVAIATHPLETDLIVA
ncbi:hypothetical protein C369_07302 [Cryptococcus neoformans A5-35-17]|nr:hypothetical protein C369_07302 [Cryptococcus neoformans var. grubii A5-35-17]